MKWNSLKAKSITLFLLLFLTYIPQIQAQSSLPVSGKVTDENGSGLTGVTVTVKGASSSTVTANDGSFKITVPTGKESLVFSYVGFQQKEVAINSKPVINITLSASQKILEDVVVIGYGTQKKRNVTGAVSSFDARKLEERPVQRIDQALVGQLAGVTVKQTTGIPGKAFSIQVRGTGSISAGNECESRVKDTVYESGSNFSKHMH